MSRRKRKNKAKKAEARQEGQFKKSKTREYFESLIVAIILALFVKTFSVQTFQIPTGSMEDGLLEGDHLIVNKLIYGPEIPGLKTIMPMREIKRGDVIIFKYPDNPKIDYIKRVIGLPEEEVRIEGTQIYIDGTPIEELGMDEDSYTLQWRNPDEDRVRDLAYYDEDRIQNSLASWNERKDKVWPVYKVPKGHYFVMGDHRATSEDSRAWRKGKEFVPRDYIIGRATIIYWSYNPDPVKPTNFATQVGGFIKAVVTFPVNTRWTRLFKIIS